MTAPSHARLLELLVTLETHLEHRSGRSGVSDALYQCGRLRHALEHAHSEGARFAAFTLGRLVGTALADDAEAARAFDALKQAMVDAGHRLAH